MERQPNKNVLKALFFKLKADYLRYIYECLSGDNGLLYGDTKKRSFRAAILDRKEMEIAEDSGELDDDYDDIDKEETLLDFMKHEVISEYDNARQEIFDNDYKSKKVAIEEGINDLPVAPFHPVFLSSLMNQQVFIRDVMMQDTRERKAASQRRIENKEDQEG